VLPPALARVQGRALPALAALAQAQVLERVLDRVPVLGLVQARARVPALGLELPAGQQQAG
jgi:hypothetical protein